MANMRLATATRNALANAITTLIDGGSGAGVVEIRSGTQPATANDVATGTLLASIPFNDPSFGAASSGVITADNDPVPEDSSADNTGTASWARVKDSAGNTVFDCDVSATGGGGTIQLNTVSIVAGGPVRITSGTITMPAG
jgi:hypothetical protein